MTDENNNPPTPQINIEIGALLIQCRIAAAAVAAGVEALQNQANALHLRGALAVLHGLATDTVIALDEAMAALWGALGLSPIAANDVVDPYKPNDFSGKDGDDDV